MEEKTSQPIVPAARTAETPLFKEDQALSNKSESLDQAIQAAVHTGGEQAINETVRTEEQRIAYGTAKTENLRDSGLWRIILPAFIILSCIALLAIPLIILVPLLYNSLNANAASNAVAHVPLVWVWIVMVVLELGVATIIAWGFLRIFTTQAGNYPR